jgi:hypothetical protein
VGAGQARHISSYTSTPDLGCTLTTSEDSADEFFNNGSSNDACGTFLVVGGVPYGPATLPAGSALTSQAAYTTWTPTSQTTTGDGSPGEPYTTVTTVAAGTTGVQLTQTDIWTLGGASVQSKMAISSVAGDTQTVQLFRAADCYVGNSDIGTGSYDSASQTAGCLHDNGDGTLTAEQLIPLTGGASSVEDLYSTVWGDIATPGPLPDTCQCSNSIDNGVATEWPLQLSGTRPVTASSLFTFAFVAASS